MFELKRIIPILLSNKISFLFFPDVKTASSTCGQRHPRGSRASSTSIIISDASTTFSIGKLE
jgi:hypothetical protein